MAHSAILRTQVEVAAACEMPVVDIVTHFSVSKTTVHRWLNAGRGERAKEAHRRWREADPEGAKDAQRRWYYGNQERARELGRSSMKKWRIQNPGQAKIRDAESYRRQYSRDPEYFARKALLRQARMKSFPMSRIERMMCNLYYREARRLTRETGVQHEVDHVWPLSRGGPHLPWNLRVITSEENRKKSDKV